MIMCKRMTQTYYHNSEFSLCLATSQIPNSGLGVYTDSFIPANTLIDEYTGMLRDHGGLYALQLIPGLFVDASVWPRCYMGIINDCTYIAPVYKKKKKHRIDITPAAYYDITGNVLKTNCEFRVFPKEKKAYIYSIVDIPIGSELFISYGDSYWS
jgi:hypothetical protein